MKKLLIMGLALTLLCGCSKSGVNSSYKLISKDEMNEIYQYENGEDTIYRGVKLTYLGDGRLLAYYQKDIHNYETWLIEPFNGFIFNKNATYTLIITKNNTMILMEN